MNLLKDYSLFWAELGLTLLGVVGLLISPTFLSRTLRPLCKLGIRISRAPKAVWVVALCSPLALRLLAWPISKFPAPSVQDEFSFLLMADTFASGRLTNPTHPMWIHFETMHVLQQPTYASMYPVMQGLFLAAGQLIAHAPWLGVWFSVALMCAAIYWALKGWMPSAWALAGAVLAAVRLGMFSYWMNSRYGGAPAAIGGALVFGALPRVCRYRRVGDSLLLAIGMVILANSRPYEGFFFCLPVAFLLMVWLFGAQKVPRWFGLRPRGGLPFRSAFVHAIIPIALVLTLAGGAMAYYFWRVTGDPLKMPYVAAAEQYGITPLFVWGKLRPEHHYNNDVFRYFYTKWNVMRPSEAGRFARYWVFYVGPALTVPLLLILLSWRDRKMRFFLAVGVFTSLALGIEWWGYPHYAAPMTVGLYALILQGLRRWRAITARMPAESRWHGSAFLVPAVVVVMIAVRFAMPALSIAPAPTWPSVWAAGGYGEGGRCSVENFLQRQAGKHLVLVRYIEHMNPESIQDEWVYNRANIDESKIVWARELDEEHNRKLLEYFKDRKLWLCNSKDRQLIPLN